MNEVKKLLGLDDKNIKILSIEEEKIKDKKVKIVNVIKNKTDEKAKYIYYKNKKEKMVLGWKPLLLHI